MERLAKGSGFVVCRGFMLEQLGAAAYAELADRVPAEYREATLDPLASKWYPYRAYGAMNEAYFAQRGFSSLEASRAGFEAMGERMARDNLNGVYRALLGFMKTRSALAMFPLAWRQYFRAARCDTETIGEGKAVLTVHHASVAYLSPVAVGWQRAALHLAAGPHATVSERTFAEGRIRADPMVYDLTW